MIIFKSLQTFGRRKSTWFACTGGVFTMALSWWLLPPPVVSSLPLQLNSQLNLSHDFRLLAISTGKSDLKDRWAGTTKFWDLSTGRQVGFFSFDHQFLPNGDSNYAAEFCNDNKKFLEFGNGNAQFRDISTGDIVKVDLPMEFPHDEKQNSQLITDAQGRHFVLIKGDDNSLTIRDLLTGQETGSFSRLNIPHFYSSQPGVLFVKHEENGALSEVREIPTGKLREGILIQRSLQITPDGNIYVTLGTGYPIDKVTVHDFRTGKQRILHINARHIYAISPDGRLIAAEVDFQRFAHPWLSWARRLIGLRSFRENGLVVYDLTTCAEVASFGKYKRAQFSLDGKRLAVLSEDNLEIYDLPLPRPWLKIVGYGLLAAALVLLMGWWCENRDALLKKLPAFCRIGYPFSKRD